ncbi:MAG TPA: MBL fold metallo-hydrolase [Candidatus Saccharimonadales bacterium]|nr:MBL fold metallo-hydrolase [Candidatus Saccharimonadales bacterium]
MSKVTFYGAAGEVTGSNFLVETADKKYLVDCGLFQGLDSAQENEQSFGFEPSQVDALIVTHAHLDHVGRVPKLVKEGFHGSIYTTAATLELAQLVLKDAFGVMEGRARENNQPNMYEETDLNRALALFKAVPYHQPTTLFGADKFTFYDAGHILGSASVALEVEGKKIIFSGDLGHGSNVLLPDTQVPREADVVVMEATYGGQEHAETSQVAEDRLTIMKRAMEWVVQNRGVLLIPAFSIERTEEVLYLMHHLFTTKQLPKIPIFLDSPLAIETLEVFERHHELYRSEIKSEAERTDIFSFRGLALTPTVPESKDINDTPPPKVIIAGSGMMEGGRITHHLQRYLPMRNTLLLVIGFQAVGTLGSRIVGGEHEVSIYGHRVPVEAKIMKAEVFSGHADNTDLVDWIKSIKFLNGERGRIMIVHAEKDRAEKFQQELGQLLPQIDTEIAKHGETVEI